MYQVSVLVIVLRSDVVGDVFVIQYLVLVQVQYSRTVESRVKKLTSYLYEYLVLATCASTPTLVLYSTSTSTGQESDDRYKYYSREIVKCKIVE